MTEKGPRKPTPPSEAPGESGDRAARRQAEDAVVQGAKADDASSPGTDAQQGATQQGKERD
ncbi:hypothetical protein [Streptomyces sp. NPDC002082]|uniref:hypothetical protein n=1 Tax=Streptomyces sp. NPDC002082 TaxID=3154772 RepID=UPI00331BF700